MWQEVLEGLRLLRSGVLIVAVLEHKHLLPVRWLLAQHRKQPLIMR
jgi:hypothetical protein